MLYIKGRPPHNLALWGGWPLCEFVLDIILKTLSGFIMHYIRHLYPLYTLKKQIFIYSLVRVLIEENIKMSEHNMNNWTDYILSLGMEVAFGNCPIREQQVADAIGLGFNA